MIILHSRWWYLFKRYVLPYRLFGVDPGCEHCGASGPRCRNFHVPNEYWRAVVGRKGGYLCFNCFFKLAVERGIFKEGHDGIELKIFPVVEE